MYGEDFFRAIFGLELDFGKLWRSKSQGAGVNQPEDPWEVRERLLYRLVLRIPKATLDLDCAGVRGGPLSGDFWCRIRLWKAVAKQITGSRCQPAGGPVLIVYQPEDPWEVRERLLRGFRGVSVTVGGLKRC